MEELELERKTSMRTRKGNRRRMNTSLSVNKSIQGDSIETMIERIREGEGEDSISDRDLVYNEGESNRVNPLTNIRSDRMELLLEEKIGEYDYKHRKVEEPKVENKEEKEAGEGIEKTE